MSTEQFFVNTLLVVLIIFAVIFIINLIFNCVFSILEYKHSKYTNNELLRMAREIIKEAQNNTPVSHTEENKITTEENNDETDYEGMTYIDLKKIAKAKNIKGYYRLHKDELIKIIKNTK